MDNKIRPTTKSVRDLYQAIGPVTQTESNTTHVLSLYLAQNAYEKGEHILLQDTIHKALESKTKQLSCVLSERGHCS